MGTVQKQDRLFIDLFSGCGGLSLGLEQAGFRPIAFAEHSKEAADTYEFNAKEHREDAKRFGDVQEIAKKSVIARLLKEADKSINPISDEVYYISPDKCTECKGFHEEPQCAAVCPVDCCVPNEEIVEDEEVLLDKQKKLHS